MIKYNKFILCNIVIYGTSTIHEMCSHIFKEIPFRSKSEIKGTQYSYNYVMIPYIENLNKDIKLIDMSGIYDDNIIKSISFFLKDIDLNQIKIFVDYIDVLNLSDIDITYSDGSFRKADNMASWAICKLTEISDEKSGTFDNFTNQYFKHSELKGSLIGTNNIGELTGLKKTVENFGDKKYQLIISDSEYSLKCYREWIYNWENNNYKGSNKKEILNKELIIETQKLIEASGKIIFFKWTRGHDDNVFNERCDLLAKEELNIKK